MKTLILSHKLRKYAQIHTYTCSIHLINTTNEFLVFSTAIIRSLFSYSPRFNIFFFIFFLQFHKVAYTCNNNPYVKHWHGTCNKHSTPRRHRQWREEIKVYFFCCAVFFLRSSSLHKTKRRLYNCIFKYGVNRKENKKKNK